MLQPRLVKLKLTKYFVSKLYIIVILNLYNMYHNNLRIYDLTKTQTLLLFIIHLVYYFFILIKLFKESVIII